MAELREMETKHKVLLAPYVFFIYFLAFLSYAIEKLLERGKFLICWFSKKNIQ